MADIIKYTISSASDTVKANQLNYLCVPDFKNTPPSGIIYDINIAMMLERYPEFFSDEVTIFTSSESAVNDLIAIGFKNAMFIPNGGYIELTNGLRIGRPTNTSYLTGQLPYQSASNIMPYRGGGYDMTMLVNNTDRYSAGWCLVAKNIANETFSIRFSYSTDMGQAKYTALFAGAETYDDGNDPYAPGGYSGAGGGGGDFDDTSIPIDFPPLPTLSAVDTGFVTLFHPSTAQLQSFANYMWNDLDLTNFHKLFNDPMEAVLGLSIVPFHPEDAGMKQVIIGNVMAISIQMPGVSTQWKEIDCGTINVNEFWGAYLDYDPFTKIEIYLPFIGVRPLNIDDVMGKTVHLKYQFDVLSGACTAMLKCGDSVLYTHSGNCATTVPIAGKDWANVINGALQVAAAVGLAVASDGAAIPAVAAASSATSGAVTSMKTKIAKSSNISGANGLISPKQPYLILTRPRQCLPKTQDENMGYPSFMDVAFNTLHGYTEVESVHLTNIEATDAELSEIYEWLERGVIF